MQRKIVAESSIYWGPLFEHADLTRKYALYSKEMDTLLSYDQWEGAYQSHLIGRPLCQSSLQRYEWLKTEIGRIHNLFTGKQLAVKFTAEEIRTILPKLKLRINTIAIELSNNTGNPTGRNLDEYDLTEMRDEMSALELEIDYLNLLLGKMCQRKINIIFDREEGIEENRQDRSNPSLEPHKRNIPSDGPSHSTINLINADQNKRNIIAALFLQPDTHPKRNILDIEGNILSSKNDIGEMLSTYSYFLLTDSGLKPFVCLTDVYDYLLLNTDENRSKVVKFRIISEYDKSNGHHVRESVSTYHVTHE